jgi:UDP-4-amino-4,6-dideoxy-N-acetyl-beta-L-altrosamine transaminase
MESIPYSRQDIDEADIAAVCDALRSDFLTQGPAIPLFEEAFAARHHVKHAVAVSSATAALHIACLALGAGPGKVVWTTPNTFLASANCARYCGADVDFVDIDPSTRNISVAALEAKLERARDQGKLPLILIPVDFAGQPADLREIRHLADVYGFAVLEDASHATGASYLGLPVGSRWADATVFSFHAVKIMTTGEGGLVTTHNAALARRMQLLRSHGMTRESGEMENPPEGPWVYEQQFLGFNYRLTDIQAALGLAQLQRLEAMHARREALASRYDQLLAGLPLRLPGRCDDRRSALHLYVVEIDAERSSVCRAEVFELLRAAGIGVNVHYVPVHTQPYYRRLGFKPGDFPCAERYYEQALTLPLFTAMTEAQQQRVATALESALTAQQSG